MSSWRRHRHRSRIQLGLKPFTWDWLSNTRGCLSDSSSCYLMSFSDDSQRGHQRGHRQRQETASIALLSTWLAINRRSMLSTSSICYVYELGETVVDESARNQGPRIILTKVFNILMCLNWNINRNIHLNVPYTYFIWPSDTELEISVGSQNFWLPDSSSGSNLIRFAHQKVHWPRLIAIFENRVDRSWNYEYEFFYRFFGN